jgi:hypothetical protein
MACGYGGCGQPYGYDHVGWGFERLPDPALQYRSVERTPQYYYVNQGPTYTGPGAYAPYPVYHETAFTGWAGYERAPSYYGGGYATPSNYGYRWHHHYHVWHHGYGPHRYAY